MYGCRSEDIPMQRSLSYGVLAHNTKPTVDSEECDEHIYEVQKLQSTVEDSVYMEMHGAYALNVVEDPVHAECSEQVYENITVGGAVL